MNNKTKLFNCLFLGGISGLIAVNHYNVLASNQTLEVLWNKEISHNGYEAFNSIIQTKDGGFIVVGEADIREDEDISRGDGVIAKYDSNGEKKWQTALEGDDTDLFYDVMESKDGNFYVIGKSFSTDIINNPNSYSNAIIVKYSSTGAMLDIKSIHDNGKQINYNSIIELDDNIIALVGEKSNNGVRTGFINILNEDCSVKKEVIIEDTNYQTEIEDVIKTSEGKIVVVGASIIDGVSNPFMAMYNKEGVNEWTYITKNNTAKEVSNLSGKLNSVLEDKNGNFVAVGYSLDEDNADGLIMVIDKTGNVVSGKTYMNTELESYSSVLMNSKNEILTVGKSKLENGKTILDNSKIVIDTYSLEYSKKNADTLYPLVNNVMSTDAIITANDEIILVGESFKVVQSVDAKCKVANEQLSDDCIHSDASILKVKFKEEACIITEKPQINADNKVINKGDTFDPKKDVTAIDGEKNDLTQKIEIILNTVDTSKEGDYLVKYKVEDKCGNTADKEIKVIVVEKKVESATDENKDKDENKAESTEKPQTGDSMLIYAGLSMISSIGLCNHNKKNKK